MMETQKENIQKVYSFCKNYFSNKKKFPALKEIQDKTELNQKEIITILKLLVIHKYLKINNNRYYFPEQKIKRHIKQPEIKKEIIKKNKIELFLNKIQSLNINLNFIFNIIIFIVFIDFIYIVIKYNYTGNLNFKDKNDALFSAIGFTLMSIIFFKKCINEFTNKKILKAIIFLIIYLILFTYNLFTILEYQYRKYQDKIYTYENLDIIKNKEKNKYLDKQIEILLSEIDSLKNEKIRQENILNSLDKDDKQYTFYYWNINGNNGFIKKIENKNKELKNFYKEKDKINENLKIEETDKRLLKGNLLKFYLFFPAFIVELFASISLVLLLPDNNKKYI